MIFFGLRVYAFINVFIGSVFYHIKIINNKMYTLDL